MVCVNRSGYDCHDLLSVSLIGGISDLGGKRDGTVLEAVDAIDDLVTLESES